MKSRALIPACRCLIFLLWTTSLIGHWLHAVFLPIWWADLLDWRCFWPPWGFTACLRLLCAQRPPRLGSLRPLGPQRGSFWAFYEKSEAALLARGALPGCVVCSP